MTKTLTTNRARALLWGTAVAALALPTVASAQDTTTTEDEDAIVITAQRRAELLEDVPMTVGVANQETLENAGATSLRDITRVISGVALNQSGGFPQPTIRGVTTLVTGTSFENNVATYVDGFYEPSGQALAVDIPNVSGIQVLKGPQGTLYGRNATGGALLLSTITPSDEWQGKAELTYGRFDDWRIGGYFAGPLTEGIGASIAAYSRRSDGWMRFISRTTPGETDGDAAPIEQDAVRAKLKFELGDSFSAILGYNFVHTSNAVGNQFTPFENVARTYLFFPATPRAVLLAAELGESAWDHSARIETHSHQGTLTLEWDTGLGTLKSLTGYTSYSPTTSFDFDGSYVNLTWSTSRFRQKTFQQAIDFAIDAIDNVDLIVGGTYFRDKLKTTRPFHIANFVGLNQLTHPGTFPPDFSSLAQTEDRRFTQDKEAWAVYVDATVHLGKFHVTAGGRYSEETQDVFGFSRCFLTAVTAARDVCRAVTPNPVTGDRILFPATNKSSSYKKFTPRASIRYEIDDRTNVYASYAQGFRSGTWNAALPLFLVGPSCPPTGTITQPCPPLNPPTQPLPPVIGGPDVWTDAGQEVVDSFEVGIKTARRNWRAELSAFLYKYKDLQVSVTNCVGGPPCAITQTIVNAPKAKIKGIEGSFEFTPFENLNLRGGFTWLHARYGDGFIFAGVGVVAPTAVGGPANTFAGINTNSDPLKTWLNVNQNQDLSGMQMSRAPDFAANFGASYKIPIRDGGFLITGNVAYTDSYVVTNPSVWCDPTQPGNNCAGVPADRQLEQRFRQGGYALFSASITYTEPSGHAYLRLWANNIGNKKYRLHYTGTSGFGTYSPMAEPRVYGASLGFKF